MRLKHWSSGMARQSLQRLGIVHDVGAAVFAISLALVTAFGQWSIFGDWQIWAIIGTYALVSVAVFRFFRLNSGAWRYASLKDIGSIVKSATMVNLLFLVATFVLFRSELVPRTAFVSSWFFLIVCLGGPRLAYRLSKERTKAALGVEDGPSGRRSAILLYGFNDNADAFIRYARRGKYDRRVVGIIDDRAKNQVRQLHGVPVVGTLSRLEEIAKSAIERGRPIRELLIAEEKLDRQTLSDLVGRSVAANIVVKRLPNIAQIETVDSDKAIEPKPVQLEDLLGREPVDLDIVGVAGVVSGRRVAVTGAGGSIGSELTRQIVALGPAELLLIDSSEFHLWQIERQIVSRFAKIALQCSLCDVRHRGHIRDVLAGFRPDVVFHAAALKHVPMVEANPIEGVDTNILGTRNVAQAAISSGAGLLVMVSTDKAVNPTSVMGASKRVAEAYCQAADLAADRTRFVTVRFGNVLGSNGSIVPLFEQQLKDGGPLTVTHPDITRFFMTIPEATRLILHAAGHAAQSSLARGAIYVLDMGEPVRILELAERLIQLAGYRPYTDIPVHFVGLRPGEKLYEELFAEDETRLEVDRPGLHLAQSRVEKLADIERALEALEDVVRSCDIGAVRPALRRIVPEYDAALLQTDTANCTSRAESRDPVRIASS